MRGGRWSLGEALEMWDDLWKFDESINVAEAHHHPKAEERKVSPPTPPQGLMTGASHMSRWGGPPPSFWRGCPDPPP